MAKVETPINTGGSRYAPSVNYNVSPQAPRQQVQEVKRPSIDLSDTIVKGLEGFVKGYTTQTEKNKKAEYDNGLNDYARKLNEIVEGQRQDAYNVSKAERMVRTLTNDYLGKGYAADDLAKVRDKYDGGLAANEEARQKKIMEHQQDRKLKEIDEAIKMYPQWSRLDDSVISAKIQRRNDVYGKLADINRQMELLDPTSDGYQQLNEQKKAMMTSEISAEAIELVGAEYSRAVQSGKEVDEQLLSTIKRNAFASLSRTYQGSAADAMFVVDSAIDETGISTLFDASMRDLTGDTEYKKKVIDWQDANTGLGLRSTQLGSVIMNLPAAVIPELRAYDNDAIKRFGRDIYDTTIAVDERGRQYVSGYSIMGTSYPEEYKETFKAQMNIINSNFADMSYPPANLVKQGGVSSNEFIGYITSTPADSDEDKQQMIKNIDTAMETYDNPVMNGAINKAKNMSPQSKRDAEGLDKNKEITKGVKAGLEYTLSQTDTNRLLSSLKNSLQADRLRIDPKTGYFVMKKGTEGFLQTAGDIFASEETRTQLNELNDFFKDMSDDERKACTRTMSKDTPLLKPGEATWDTSKSTIGEDIEGLLRKSSSKALQFLESNEEAGAKAAIQATPAAGSVHNISEAIKRIIEKNNGKVSEEEMKEIDEAIASGRAIMGTPVDPDIAKLQERLDSGELKPNIQRAVQGAIDKLTSRATMKSSETLANADLTYTNTEQNLEAVVEREADEKETKENIAAIKKILPSIKDVTQRRALEAALEWLNGQLLDIEGKQRPDTGD